MGTAGVGKTALALHWAHSVAAGFPDGSLYLNLRGFDPSNAPLEPGEALNQFIRAIGLPGRHPIPPSLEERAALFRTLTQGRRMLVVLDNALDSEQVRPLIPSSPGCFTLVTSRHRLGGLVIRDGASRVTISPLSRSDSVSLLTKLLPSQVVADGRPDDLPTLADRCARLPLALRVAAEVVSRTEFVPLNEIISQLGTESQSLDTLTVRDDEAAAVESVFSWSYRALSHRAARTFRLIGLHTGASITVPTIAALLGESEREARQGTQELVDAHLIKETSRDRFRLHDLLRAYAIRRVHEEESAEFQRAARERVLFWYLHTADRANRVLAPHRRHVALPTPPPGVTPLHFTSYESAIDWCESERLNLVSAIRSAEETGFPEIGWKLPAVLFSFFYVRNYSDDWVASYTIGSRVAARLSDREAESVMSHRLGVAHKEAGHFQEALAHFERALRLREEIGDRVGAATALSNIGLCVTGLGEPARAIDIFRESLRISEEVGDTWTRAWTLHNLGEAQVAAGRLPDALASGRESLRLADTLDDQIVQELALHQLGAAYHQSGDYAAAAAQHIKALQISRNLGHRVVEAGVLMNMGDTLRLQEHYAGALAAYTEASVLYEAIGDRSTTAEILLRIAHVLTTGSLDHTGQAPSLRARAAAITAELNSATPNRRSISPGGQADGGTPD